MAQTKRQSDNAYQLSKKAEACINKAKSYATAAQYAMVGQIHLLKAIVEYEPVCAGGRMLANTGINMEHFKEAVRRQEISFNEACDSRDLSDIKVTRTFVDSYQSKAKEFALKDGSDLINTDHIL